MNRHLPLRIHVTDDRILVRRAVEPPARIAQVILAAVGTVMLAFLGLMVWAWLATPGSLEGWF